MTDEAEKWYLKAIEVGGKDVSISMFNLGNLYYFYTKQYDSAVKYYTMAFNHNYMPALAVLILLCIHGHLKQETVLSLLDSINSKSKMNELRDRIVNDPNREFIESWIKRRASDKSASGNTLYLCSLLRKNHNNT